jgi:hypothetical protein
MSTNKFFDEKYNYNEIIYPQSDGKPMADNTLQYEWVVTIKEGLEIEHQEKKSLETNLESLV